MAYFIRTIKKIIYELHLRTKLHVRLFSKNSRERWVRVGEQVMCGSMFLYILGIRHYAPNTFSALPNSRNRQILARILANTPCKSQFLQLFVNLWFMRERPRMLTNIRNLPILWEMIYVWFRHKTKITGAYETLKLWTFYIFFKILESLRNKTFTRFVAPNNFHLTFLFLITFSAV